MDIRPASTVLEQLSSLVTLGEWVTSWSRESEVYKDNSALAEVALKQSMSEGLFCEFGVYKGQSTRFISQRIRPRILHAFDSFQGLPAQPLELTRPGWGEGAFSVDQIPHFDEKNICLHVGWFHQTLPGFVTQNPGDISFIYMDADLYSSTKLVLDYLRRKIVPGTVILFDEFWKWPGWETKSEARAWFEYVTNFHVPFECIGVTRDEQVAVRVTSGNRNYLKLETKSTT